MTCERSGILASHIGAMERQLETCITYARTRRQFNQPIGQFQSVSNRIADMKVRLETARLFSPLVVPGRLATSTGTGRCTRDRNGQTLPQRVVYAVQYG